MDACPGGATNTIKAKIHDEEDILSDQQCLIAFGKQLKDDHTLSYYTISNHGMVFLVRKLSVLASEETIREDDESVDDDESVTTSVDDDTCDV